MAALQDILSDPNYVNANAATKAAIFDKFAPLDPNFANANFETQGAIRTKFGLGALEQPVETRQNVGAELPSFAKTSPNLYAGLVKTRQMLGPTAEMLGGVAGGVLGAGAGAIASPTVVINPVTGGVAGSALGYATAKELLNKADVALGLAPAETGSQAAGRAAGNVAEGAAFEVGGQVAGKVLNKLADAGSYLAGKVADLNQLPKQLAAKVAKESFETPANVAAGRNALQEAVKADDNVTAQQALAQGGVVAPGTQALIQKVQAKVAPSVQATKDLADEAARMSTIKEITPDLDAAVKLRKETAKPFFTAADETIVPIDKDVSAVLARMPEGTLAAAAKIAKMEGRPFIMGKVVAEQKVPNALGTVDIIPAKTPELTGESMHYIKRALSDVAYGPTTTEAGRDTQLAAQTLLKDYTKVFESKVPPYAEARKIYSDLSAPVNQAQVLKEMASVLEKPGGGERIGPFLNVLGRGETAMLKRAGGKGAPRFEALDEVLTPEQLQKVMGVAKQLETDASVGLQISQGQQHATDLLKKHLASFRLPNIFNIVATTANKVLDTLGVKVGQKTLAEITKASENAQSFDELLALLPGQDRVKVLKAISDPDTWANIHKSNEKLASIRAKYAMGLTADVPQMPANALAPEQPNQNALAR